MTRPLSRRVVVSLLSVLAVGGVLVGVAHLVGLRHAAAGESAPLAQRGLPEPQPNRAAPGAHVLIIGIDGLGAAEIRTMPLDHIGRLIKEGASTLHARGVLPTVSSPNWASMIMGAPPELHGVTSNDWRPGRPAIPPMATGPSGQFPTIFGVVRRERPAAVIGVFHEWDGFARLLESDVANVIERHGTARRTTERAAAFIREKNPTLTFVHLDLVDLAGHEFGWNSREYRRAAETADMLVGQLLAAVRESGAEERTTVIVSSDHGGMGYSHGAATLRELEIPWIVRGPGIARGLTIEGPVSTCDTAPTVAALLGLPVPPIWTGRAVVDAFEQ